MEEKVSCGGAVRRVIGTHRPHFIVSLGVCHVFVTPRYCPRSGGGPWFCLRPCVALEESPRRRGVDSPTLPPGAHVLSLARSASCISEVLLSWGVCHLTTSETLVWGMPSTSPARASSGLPPCLPLAGSHASVACSVSWTASLYS